MPGIVEGRKWLQARLAFLQERLDAGPPEPERKVIEDEIAQLRAEMRHHGPWRWLRFLGRSTDL